MPGPLFKRWAPPKKSITKQSSSVASSPESAPIPNSQVCHSPEGSQDKKSKKSKKRVIEDSEPVQTEKGEDVEAVLEETSADTPKSIKKQKKRKLDLDVNEAQDEETSKKHKSIFSKFEKVSKRAEVRSKHNEDDNGLDAQENEQVEVLHDLEPLPQPAPVPEPDFEPTFSTLPSWLAHPISVEADRKVPFSELGVHSFYLKKLEKQGFEDALAVQSALLPMLHPGFDQHLGDICVSAKTGSGKTLAYLLPIIEALRDRASPVLSAIIVVPTRQLVDQALQVAEELCTGTKVRVGTAVGSVPLATEQKELVKLRPQYDPQKAKQLHERVSRQFETGFIDRRGFFNDLMSMQTDHIPRYDSGVDILICTPGRLVEHIESTTGFLLNSVQWLVIDEADQLLNQNFQGWATALMDALYEETPDDFKTAQGRLRKREEGFFWDVALPTRRQLTKVVLSATMERDLTKLATLRLKRPKLVVVQDEPSEEQVLANEGDIFELPSTLDESAVPVNDGQNKPLHLLHLLVHHVFQGIKSTSEEDSSRSESSLDDFPDSSSSSSSSDSSDSSDSSTSDSSESEPDDDNNQAPSIAKHKSRVLIFTKSNESASRLSHLLSILEPSYKDYLKTMTPSSTAKASKKLLRSFSSGVIKILIASDAASRGLDIPDLSHVINYDMPSSITSYVHRVGRTARAGKSGQAWTLFTKTEAAWFWKQIARGNNVLRGGRKVKRVEWKEKDVTADGKKQAYRAALDALEGAVKGSVDTTA